MRYSGPFEDFRGVMRQIETVQGVAAATPFIYSQVMLRTASATTGAVLRGIDPETVGRVMKTLESVKVPEAGPAGGPEGAGAGCRASSSAGNWPRIWAWSRATWST